ncbi:MAG: T9SS type A sorting domain-containing protein [Bacteroidia bacterium]
MKSKLLLGLFFSATLTVGAQKSETQNIKQLNQATKQVLQALPGQNNLNSGARVDIWTNDFSVPSDWEFEDVANSGDNWVIGTMGSSGEFDIGTITSTTADNGFALFDSDLSCSGNQIVNLTTTGSVDCSLYPFVTLEFEQLYGRFNDSTFVFVSNDGGSNWDKYAVNEFRVGNYVSTNPEVIKLNISNTASNQADVKIRFQFWSPSSYTGPNPGGPGCGFAWMIDDIKLSTPPDYELSVISLNHGDPILDWEYGIYPLNQADTTTVFAIVTNQGALSQNVTLNYDILLGTTSVNSGASSSFDLAPFTTDTVVINTGYIPDAIGNYNLTVELTSANTDATPADNSGSSTFRVSEYVYSGIESLSTTVNGTYSSEISPGVFEIIKSGQFYNIINDDACKAIDIAVSRTSTANTELLIELLQSDLATALALGDYTITSSHPSTAQYITIQLDQTVDLTANTLYAAAVGSLTNDKQFFMYLNDDGDVDNAAFIFVDGQRFGALETPAVGLNLDITLGIVDVNGNDMLSVYPNPANQSLTINFELNGASNVAVNLIDLNGKAVFTKTISGKVLKYQDTISLLDFANGIYTLQISTSNGISSEKVVIAH